VNSCHASKVSNRLGFDRLVLGVCPLIHSNSLSKKSTPCRS
jgi:hypothetical protein